MAPVLLGSLVGVLVLISSSERAFVSAIPFLLVIAVVSILFGTHLRRLTIAIVPAGHQALLTSVLLLGCGFYGDYFGAGLGFMLLAVLGVAGIEKLQRANALKLLRWIVVTLGVVLTISFLLR